MQMDASGSATQLTDQWTLVWSAPAFALGLLVIVAGAMWWLRGTLGKSEVKGLKVKISAAQEAGKTLQQRLAIAREQEQAAVATRQQIEAQIAELQREVVFSPERIRARVRDLVETVAGMESAQNALANTLSPSTDEANDSRNSIETEARNAGTQT
jgi:hypothetical protein